MNDADEMSAEEVVQALIIARELDYMAQMHAMREFAAIHPELDAALGAYMAGLDPEAKAAALKRFDIALDRLREANRKHDYQWDKYVKDPYLFREVPMNKSELELTAVESFLAVPELWNARIRTI